MKTMAEATIEDFSVNLPYRNSFGPAAASMRAMCLKARI